MLSNYLSRQALVLCGSRYHMFDAVPTGEFSAVFQPTDLREAVEVGALNPHSVKNCVK